MSRFTESVVEDAALDTLDVESLGYTTLHGDAIAPEAPSRTSEE